jgi:hypothetical protein
MSRFGDFTLLEDLGRSATSDRYKATHATQGGPFFLKVHRRLDRRWRTGWKERADRLIGRSHVAVAGHLGHGIVDDTPFSVSPWLEGLDLPALVASMTDRRVHLAWEHCFVLLADLAQAVGAIHGWAPSPSGPLLVHGDVSRAHVRVGPDGQVWLTGLATPRTEAAGAFEARLDLAGVGALLYDLVPLLRGGSARPPLPTLLDRVIRRSLAIGPAHEHLTPTEFVERLADVADGLKVKPDRAGLADAVRRTIRAVGKKAVSQPPRGRAPADAIPELVPVGSGGLSSLDDLPELQPLSPRTPSLTRTPVSTAPSPASPPSPPPAPLPSFLASLAVPAAAPVAPALSSSSSSPSPPSSVAPVAPVARAGAAADDGLFLTGSAGRLGVRPPATPAGSPAPSSIPPGAAAWAGLASPSPPPASPPPSSSRPASPPLSSASPGAAPWSALASSPVPSSASSSPPSPSPSPVPSSPALATSPVPSSTAMPASPGPATVATPPSSSSPLSPPPPSVLAATRAGGGAGTPAVPELLAGLDAVLQRAKPRVQLLSDGDEPLGASPPAAAPSSSAAGRHAPFDHGEPARARPDADSTRTIRIAQQRALPSVQALLAAGAVSAAQVDAAVAEQAVRGGRVLEILVGAGALTDDVLAATLARAAGRPLLADADLHAPVDAALLRRMPRTYALARRLLPLRLADGALLLAIADPFDAKVIDEVRTLLHAAGVDVRVAPRAALTRATLAAFGAGEVVAGPRVLLCTQDDAKAQQLGARLAQEGMQVEHVVEGATARQILSMNPPHAVLCAHDLPEVDGRALLLFARGQDRLVELPFYVLGPRGDDDLAARMLELGADDFFADPLRGDVIVAKLRRAVGKRVESAAPAPPPPPRTEKKAAPAPVGDEFAFEDLPDLPPELDGGAADDDVPAMPTGVMGTLRQMSLPEIVQSLEMGRKTASVDIVPQDGEKGRIAFSTGAIQFAECGALAGDQAFYALMRHREGFFRIHYGDAPPSVNIHAPTTFLLLEAMRLMDEEGGVGGP